MKTNRKATMWEDEIDLRGRPARAVSAFALLVLILLFLPQSRCEAQSGPPMVVTTQTTISTALQGPFGTVATNYLGDVFVGGSNTNTTIEFPASGAAPIVVYNSSTGGHAGAVAIDPNQNLIVTERYNDVIYLIPYLNSTYTPYTYSAPPIPPNCTSPPASAAACNYDSDLLTYQNSLKSAVTGYYFQPIAIAFDPAGNSFIATNDDNVGGNNIYECTVACNYSAANNASLLYHHTTYIDAIAVDTADNVYLVDGSENLYEVKAGAKTSTIISTAFSSAQGVSLDQAGNLYVSDNGAGVYQVPFENGALNPADMFLIFPLTSTSKYGQNNIEQTGVALDQHGNIFATDGYEDLLEVTVGNALLPATALGSTSAAATLYVAFNKATTLKSTAVTAAGVASKEFAVIASGTTAGTCVTGTAYKVGASCTLAVTFSPATPGLRTAVLTLTDTSGDSVPVYLSGTGLGQAITVDPATQSSIGSNFKTPDAVAVDAAGNVFVADSGADTVYEYPGGAGSGTAIGSGLRSPAGIAVDAGGNLYISDTGNDRVVMIPNNAGVLDPASQTTLVSDVKSPEQLSVDSNGTLYIAETGNDDVISFVSRAGLGSTAITSTPLKGLSSPSSVAVDSTGRLYITDTGNNRVVEFSDGAISTVGSGLSAPAGLTLDASGSVIVADQGNGRIVRIPNESGVLTSSDQITVNSSIASPHAVQVDATGNLYAADNVNAAAYFLNRTTGAIDFGRVNGKSTSVEETAVLASSGPADLTFGKPLYPPLSTSNPFSVTSPSSGGCASLTGLASGATCTLDTLFAPGTSIIGLQNYAVDFKTGAQNATSPSLQLSGTAVNLFDAKVALIQTLPVNGEANYGSPVTFKATVVSASGKGNTPTGTVEFIVDGANGQPQTLDAAGAASLTLNGLSGGSHSIAASYSGDNYYAPEASSTLTIVILPDASATTLSIVGYAINPLTAEPPDPANTDANTITMTAVVVPSIQGALSGPVNFMSGGKVLGTASVIGTTSGSKTIYTAVLTATTIPAGNYDVVANFAGNSNYVASTSSATQLIVTQPKFILAESSSAVTSSKGDPGSTNISVTSYSGFTGGVDFACSGLPANATCQFVPAVLSLTATGTVPINVPVLTTTLNVLVDQAPVVTPTGIFWWSGLLLGLSLFGLAGNRRARRRLWLQCMGGAIFVASLSGVSACGGAASFTTPTGTSKITVSATASPAGATTGKSDVTQSMQLTLTVK